ncbi:MAG: MotA/TolQ/ExbB proton channel family protein [Kiritimatiellaceae bacterium]|nr:MotA/TolQ/ExbB proton channel family protein [Kiritimatiellaceae bacterium]
MKKSYLKTVVMLVMLVAIAGFAVNASAQEASGEDAPQENVQKMTFGQMLKQGGWAMWPLGAFSSAMLFFIIRNSLLLRPKNLLREDLKAELEAVIQCNDINAAREICQNNPSLMTSVLDAGLERIDEDDFDAAHVSEAIEEAGNEQMVTFMKPINYLSIIGGTAPMLGLLGTVSGMIKAFQTIAAGGMGKPELLAGNIGEALITTATGLIIAIPAMISYFIFKNNFIKNMSTMGRMVSHFLSIYRNTRK